MSDRHQLAEQYMSRFEASLSRYDLPDRAGIAADLQSHIDEALQYGRPLDEVLRALGPADMLARAYAVELLINPPPERSRNAVMRLLGLIGILAAGSIASLIVVGMLGSIGVGFTVSGIAIILIALLESLGVHLPGVQTAGIHPMVIMLLGAVITAVGAVAAWGLWRYLRFVARAIAKALPRRTQAAA